MMVYGEEWFAARQAASRRAAERVVPLVLEAWPARSVVDVGCGTADWLAVFAARGVVEILGLDGEYVDQRRLAIAPDRFRAANLGRGLPEIGRKYDLAVSVEVAEHLPPERADSFVAELAGLSDAVLFSAAIPYQGGAGHVNEQWPAYWAERFARHGFFPRDVFRRRLWDDPDVAFWYAQNLLLYVKGERPSVPAALVHPTCYLNLAQRARPRAVLEALPRLVWKTITRRFRSRQT